MKPPPRARSKPNRYLQRRIDAKRRQRQLIITWKRAEKKQLLSALRKLGNIVGGTGEIDYAFLNQHLPQRTIPEVTPEREFEFLSFSLCVFVKFKAGSFSSFFTCVCLSGRVHAFKPHLSFCVCVCSSTSSTPTSSTLRSVLWWRL